MKTLKEYIQESLNRSWNNVNHDGLQSIDEFLEINGLSEYDVNEGVWFRYFNQLNGNREYDDNYDWQTYIHETLIKSHDSDLLSKKKN